jgi:hypothetical protein
MRARVPSTLPMLCLAWTASAIAQTDEIHVYNAEIAAPGVFNLTLHDNYTPDGRASPRYPGGITPNRTLNGVPEWAYGVTDWFEAGLYLPLYSLRGTGALTNNGFKVRTLFVKPDAAEQPFFYGVNFEFSWNTAHWDPNRHTQEIRPSSAGTSGRTTSSSIQSSTIPTRDFRNSISRRPLEWPTTSTKLGRSRPRNMMTSDPCEDFCRRRNSSTSGSAFSTTTASPGRSREE